MDGPLPSTAVIAFSSKMPFFDLQNKATDISRHDAMSRPNGFDHCRIHLDGPYTTRSEFFSFTFYKTSIYAPLDKCLP